MIRMTRCRLTIWLALSVPALMSGCGRDRSEPEAVPATPPQVVSPQPAAPAVDPTAPPVSVREVAGWQLVPNPRAGVAYQYVRTNHTEPFRPSVTVTLHESSQPTLEAYATAERNSLVQANPSMVIIAEQIMTTQTPPVAKIVFQYERDQQKLQVMQLYFLRSSGQVVIVTFQSLISQWEHLQPEFKQVLAALQVAP
ncbi:MAG: hypothetical protein GX134_03525 [candidate division WS1 bacterium]|nr:hypothetical protein [candidate division WS1 bacterium]